MSRAGSIPGYAALLAAALALVLAGGDARARDGWGGHGGWSGHSHAGGRSGSHHHAWSGAHRRGTGSTVFFGGYWAGPAYWFGQVVPYPPSEPVRYIERSEEERQPDVLWHYCESVAGYHPYVAECPEGWVVVAPFAAQ